MKSNWLWTLLCLNVAVVAQNHQRIIVHPNDATVLLGDTVTLKCQVQNQQGAVQWSQNGFGLGSDRALSVYSRYSMVGSSAAGEYNLEIKNAQLSDDAKYQCILLPTDTQSADVSNQIKLTVVVKPSPPILEGIGLSVEGTEGKELALTCISAGGKPQPVVTWAITTKSDGSGVSRVLGSKKIKAGEKIKESNLTVSSSGIVTEEVSEKNNVYNVRSNLRFKPVKGDDEKYLVCLVGHDTIEGSMATAAKISLEYAPKATITLKSTEPLKEGSSAILACNIDAKPRQGLKIEWRRNGNMLIASSSDLLSLAKLDREYQNSVFECIVSNRIGTGRATYIMKLSYGPVINSISNAVSVDVGDTVVLSCDVSSNPPAVIEWSKVGHEHRVLQRGSNFTINDIGTWDQGNYQCLARATGFPEVKDITSVFINGPPNVILPNVVEVNSGEIVHLTCTAYGYPKSTVSWYRGKTKIDRTTKPKRYEFSDMNPDGGLAEGSVSILIINGVEQSDFGYFNCSANNAKGFRSKILRLVPVDPLPLYLMIPGVIAGCVIILLLALAMIIMNRRTLCKSKLSSNRSNGFDDHSDVQVKVEALDGRAYPVDMYGTTQTSLEQAEIVYGKDYMALPQDNPDFDLLPPPYTHVYNSNGSPNGVYHNGGPQALVQMTYLDGPPSTHLVYPNPEVTYQSFMPEPVYYPSMNGMAPLATLETVQEVPTPDTETGTPLLIPHRIHNGLARDYSSSEHERSASRGSTHV